MTSHNDLVQQAFTQQANAYAANPLIKDRARLEKLVHSIRPFSDARVLDVATGPGYLAGAFASVCKLVIGIDLTQAALFRARAHQQSQRVDHLHFVNANARGIPFGDDTFDIVVSRFAVHHFEQPISVLADMARVCKSGGIIAIQDLVTSEHFERAAFQNKLEKLRDRSHATTLPISQFLTLFTQANLEIVHVETETLVQDAEQWLANASTPNAEASEVRQLLKKDILEDLSGVQPFYDGEKRLHFTQNYATVIGRRLPRAI